MAALYHVLLVIALHVYGLAECKPQLPPNGNSTQGPHPASVDVYADTLAVGGGESRIIGGKRAGYAAIPYQASVQERNYHICGGTLLDERHVLTAAHCVTTDKGKTKKASIMKIGVGSTKLSGVTKYQVQYIWVHYQYRVLNGMPNHDIALLRVKGTVRMSDTVKPIALWPLSSGAPWPSTMCNVSGWGAERNEGAATYYLNYVSVPIRNQESCRRSYQFLPTYPICAGEENRDSCQGDSGGPLVCNGLQAGIVSFGIKCGLQQYPGVYTDVSYYADWIDLMKERSKSSYVSASLSVTILLSTLTILLGTNQGHR